MNEYECESERLVQCTIPSLTPFVVGQWEEEERDGALCIKKDYVTFTNKSASVLHI